jgi:hypothetical protein
LPSLLGARLLIETVVYSAIDPRIVYVVGHLREPGVVKGHLRESRMREGDVMASLAEDLLGYLARSIATGCVSRWIAGKTGRAD